MKALVVIPARGGSKGLPGKNIKLLDGKPLIHYTIDIAREIFNDDCIYVSTDSKEIIQVAEKTGLMVPFIRPDYLATDSASTQDVLLHALAHYSIENNEPDIVILLQPTSPLRKIEHITDALDLYKPSLDMIVSVKETDANPYYVLYEENENGFLKKSKESNFMRRQDCPKVWEYNGSIYVINTKSLKEKKINKFNKVVKYIMDDKYSIDIDNELDFKMVELIKTSIL